uniref:Uncharacterized protein n=1 Tax=Anguilla anguilla TaxID=7936 RepID=A0A0E9SK95_ANGAN
MGGLTAGFLWIPFGLPIVCRLSRRLPTQIIYAMTKKAFLKMCQSAPNLWTLKLNHI